jgi:hypothetical protein
MFATNVLASIPMRFRLDTVVCLKWNNFWSNGLNRQKIVLIFPSEHSELKILVRIFDEEHYFLAKSRLSAYDPLRRLNCVHYFHLDLFRTKGILTVC